MSDDDDLLANASDPSALEAEAKALIHAARQTGAVPPHPSVGDRAWRRVEDGLRPRPWLGKGLLGAGAALVLTAGLLAYALRSPPERPAPPELVFGRELRTEAEPARFEVGGKRILVGAHSVIVFLHADKHELKAGRAEYDVERRAGGVELSLVMGPWDVRVEGSRFLALRNERENMIEVFDGRLHLKTSEREIELGAGDTIKESLEAVAPARAETPRTPPEPPTPPSGDPPRPSPGPKPPPSKKSSLNDSTTRPPTLAQALELVRAKRYDEAEAVYREIAVRVPRDAEVALFALAKMKLHKQRSDRAGLLVLDELDVRFPTGELRQERLLSRIEVLFRTARCEEAKAAMVIYVKEYTHALDSLKEIDASQCSR